MKKLILLALLLFNYFAASAQDPEKIKKFETKMAQSDNDSIKALYLAALYKQYEQADPKKALRVCQAAIAPAKKGKYDLLLANCYYYSAAALFMLGNTDSSIYYLDLEKQIREAKKDTTGLAYCLRKAGDCYSQQGKLVKATKYYFEAIRLWELKKDYWNCANVYVDLGNVYYYQKKLDKTIQYYNSAAETFYKANDSISESILRMNMATIYMEQNNIQKSLEEYQKVNEKLIVGYPQPEVPHGYFINRAMLNMKLHDFATAEKLLAKASAYYSDSANSVIKLNQGSGMAEFYVTSKNYKQGMFWSDKLVKYAKEISSLEYEKTGLGFLARSNAGLSNYKEAYENFMKYDSIKDSLLSQENRKLVSEMESEFQTAKKELENNNLKAEAKVKDAEIATAATEKKRQNILIIAIACILVLTVAFLYFVFRSLQQNKKKNRIITEQKMEVDRAYAQLNEKNKEVLDSIHYAKRIQMALMSNEKNIARKLNSVRKK